MGWVKPEPNPKPEKCKTQTQLGCPLDPPETLRVGLGRSLLALTWPRYRVASPHLNFFLTKKKKKRMVVYYLVFMLRERWLSIYRYAIDSRVTNYGLTIASLMLGCTYTLGLSQWNLVLWTQFSCGKKNYINYFKVTDFWTIVINYNKIWRI